MAQAIQSAQAEGGAAGPLLLAHARRQWGALRASRYYRPVRSALLLVTCWRLLLGVAGWIMNVVAPHCACPWNSALRAEKWSVNPLTLAVDAASRGDAQYYVDAAQHGYVFSTQHFSSMGFYPLYPILIKATSLITGNAYVAALVVSTICLLAAVGLLAMWLVDRGMGAYTGRVLLLMFTFPFAFFYGAMYTEPVYLALVLAAFLAAERRRWVLVSVCAALLTLTRPTGVLILIPLVTMMPPVRTWRGRHALPFATCLLALAGFMLYQFLRFGTPLAYVRAKAVPGWAVSPARVVRDLLLQGQPGRSSFLLALMLAIALAFLASIPLVHQRLGRPYAVFVAVTVLGALSAGLPGMHRYVVVAFPTFVALAPRLKNQAIVALATGGAYLLLLFLSGYVGGYGIA